MNALCGQKQLARVSKTPGRTQLINMFNVPNGRFVDLPGYGFAKVPKDVSQAWGRLIGDYLQGRSEEHTLELQSLMRISYAVFCVKQKTTEQPKVIHRYIR